MPHPDLYDDLNKLIIQGYDEGNIYCRIVQDKGLVINHVAHGGIEDAIPRRLIIIASTLNQYIENGGDAQWDIRNGIEGILWLDENNWQPLSDIGVNKRLGFYSRSQFPNELNDAQLLDEER